MYAAPWFMTLFGSLKTLPLPTVERVWDVFLVDGWKVLFRCGLTLLHQMQESLLRHDFCTVMELLQRMSLSDTIFCSDDILRKGRRFKVTRSMLAFLEEEWKRRGAGEGGFS
jgi:hypothetical protein